MLVVEIQISRLVYPQLGRRVVARIGVRIACGFLNMSSVSSTATKIDPCLCFVMICNNRRNLKQTYRNKKAVVIKRSFIGRHEIMDYFSISMRKWHLLCVRMQQRVPCTTKRDFNNGFEL